MGKDVKSTAVANTAAAVKYCGASHLQACVAGLRAPISERLRSEVQRDYGWRQLYKQ